MWKPNTLLDMRALETLTPKVTNKAHRLLTQAEKTKAPYNGFSNEFSNPSAQTQSTRPRRDVNPAQTRIGPEQPNAAGWAKEMNGSLDQVFFKYTQRMPEKAVKPLPSTVDRLLNQPPHQFLQGMAKTSEIALPLKTVSAHQKPIIKQVPEALHAQESSAVIERTSSFIEKTSGASSSDRLSELGSLAKSGKPALHTLPEATSVPKVAKKVRFEETPVQKHRIRRKPVDASLYEQARVHTPPLKRETRLRQDARPAHPNSAFIEHLTEHLEVPPLTPKAKQLKVQEKVLKWFKQVPVAQPQARQAQRGLENPFQR